MQATTAIAQAIQFLDQAYGHNDSHVNEVCAKLGQALNHNGAIRLLRSVSAAAPKKRNKWTNEARIPWTLIEEIRAALTAIDA